jgi:hypothetical protein
MLGIAVSARRANRTKVAAEHANSFKSALVVSDDKQSRAANAPNAAVISATLSDNTPAATRVTPGSTINYTAVITNSGAASPGDDATNLNYSDTLDANTTLVAGSAHASPIAFNDTYNWVGNTFLDTTARGLPTVTANDIAANLNGGADTFTVTTIAGGTTSLGGSVTLAANGSFTYTPPLGRPNIADGVTATDTFTYTIANSADGTLTATGTVTIALTGRVWYLQAGAAGDGRSNTPSGSPSAMSTAADKSTDIFYIFSNAGSLNGLFTVDAGQQLLGQAVNLVVNSITLFTAAAPTPTTTNTTGNCVTLSGAPGNNTLSGFNIGNCTGLALQGASVGTLTISSVSINTTGGGLDLTGVGTPTVNIVLGGLTATGGTVGANLVGLNGTINLAGGTLSGASGAEFTVSGGAPTVTYTGAITQNNAQRVVNIQGTTTNSVTLSGTITGGASSLGVHIGDTTAVNGNVSFTTLNLGTSGSRMTNQALTISNGGSSAIYSLGTVNIFTNNVSGLVATNFDGTLNNTAGGTIDTNGGTTVNIDGPVGLTTSGLSFTKLFSDTGTSTGLIIQDTNGSFTVTGSGSACTSSATCTGGSLSNKTGTGLGGSGTDGVFLNNATNVSLTRMNISDNNGNGVFAGVVNGIRIDNCFINSNADNTTGADYLGVGFNNEGNVHLVNVSGTALAGANPTAITNSTVTNAFEHDIEIDQTTGTLADFQINNSTISNNGASTQAATRVLFIENGGTGTLTVQDCTLVGNRVAGALTAAGIQATVSSGTQSIKVFRNLLQNHNVAVDVSTSTSGVLNFDITDNGGSGGVANNGASNGRIIGSDSVAVNVFTNANSTGSANGFIRGNTIGIQGTAGSGSVVGRGMQIQNEGSINIRALISGNIVQEVTGNQGINVQHGIAVAGVAGTTNATITNNTVRQITGGSRPLNTEILNTGTLCSDIQGNTLFQPGQGGGTSVLRLNRTNGTYNNRQLSAADLAVVNTLPAGGTVTVAGVINFNQGPCTQPTAFGPVSDSDKDAVNRPGVPSEVSTGQIVKHAIAAHTLQAQTTSPAVAKSGAVSAKAMTISVNAKSTQKATAEEVARIYRSERVLSHHAVRVAQGRDAPTAGETVTFNSPITLPAQKQITIKYAATVNTTVLTARQASTQGTVTANGGINVQTDDPDVGGTQATITLLDTTLTWTGATSTDWNDAANWTRPGPVVSSYAPGVTNPAVNDVVIPNVGNQPNIGTTDIDIYSLNIANGRILTISPGRTLTIDGAAAGSDLTLDGIITGGALNFAGAGPHVITNAGGTGSLSSTNVMTLVSPASVTLNNNLQAGAVGVNSGATFNITNRTLSLNGSGAALAVGGTLTTTGSTIAFNGTAAQTAAGVAYNNLTINNTIGTNVTGVTLTGNATVNGVLALTSSDLDTSTFTLTQPNTTASTGVSDVVGTVTRTGGPFALATPLTFGNPNNIITFTAGTNRPTTLTVLMAKTAPATYAAAVQRNYTISLTGTNNATATVRLHYLDGELNGNVEASLNLRRLRTSDSHWVAQLPTTRDTANNWVESNNVLAADLPTQWTFSSLAPTASDGVVTGRIVDNNGNPVEGAVVRLQGTQNRKFITDANGVYRFDNVETSGFYTVTPSRVNYTFSPAARSFSQIGETTEAGFGATLSTSGFVNPLDTPEYFVRQHYLDFLGREPDEAGFNFWSDQILGCGGDQECISLKRENVSAAYFISIEFQKTGGLVDRLYRASYGRQSQFSEFMPDTRAVGLGVQVGKEGWEALLAANKEAFLNTFVNRPAFHAAYDGMDHSLFVDTLISHTGVSFTSGERDALVSGLGSGTMTRAEALRSIAEDNRFVNAKFNEAFVMMEYFGYLRRDPDSGGFAFWLNKLNEFNGNFVQAEMVKAFIVSGEYRDRFPR